MRLSSVLWPLFFLSHWLLCGFIAWHLFAKVDFAYPLAYQALNIEEHIQTYGPQNRYRDGFANTDEAQHLRLFAEINQAIHQDPAALADITYTTEAGSAELLLRRDEVIHLQDVARLVEGVYTLGWACLALSLLSVLILHFRRSPLPRARNIIAVFTGVISLACISVLLIGPKKVFYTLHTWVFPPDHPWFFYYQDSLMTTLMKAPDLFGFIAVLLLLLWMALWGISLPILVRLWR
ncbi:DUF1461 domain-containing protein [Gilvimarinus sp. DA14]|uniref:lipoprotein intramolecular transacylase Lit n=1 Tax=Gilvimarinus sp. DA14 TaxID=2956798 RepID=UPI0020B8FC04|nr:DUF1461 domain-containing protein [Gilvimarinus sp. DA14]UTF61049.1 DUF1461 domain-containing protein [Gilvimarinus sp. DA14]